MVWNLYEKERFLEPLKFSNGKTQEDIVKEVLDLIENGKKIIFIRGICGTGKCLDKNSLIFCKLGGEKYFSYYKISEIEGKYGKIISKDYSGNLVEANFKNVQKTGIKKLYHLKTRTGREILASENHQFLTITENGTEWKQLKELNEKSYICLPNKIEIKSNVDYEDNKIKILAHLIAEGKLGDKAGSPKYYQCSNQNPYIRKDYIDALKDIFPEGIIKERDKAITIKFGLMNTTKGTTNKLRLFIREHGLDGKKSGSKFVPAIIFNLKKEKIAIFLSRLFSCDGCIYSRGKQSTIEYSSISKRLVDDVSILLNIFGIQHTISSKKFRDNKNYSWRICISNQESLRKYIEEIGFIGRKQNYASEVLKKLKNHKFTNIDKIPRIIREYLKKVGYNYTELDRFLNYDEICCERENKNFKEIIKDKLIETPNVFKQGKIDFLRCHLRKINNIIKDEKISEICNQDIYWDKIKSIKFVKEDETYDLEVEENHNFITNGIIVHNSAIALNIAKNIGQASIIVPGKTLQNQYKADYEEDKYLLKENGNRLKISVITGRNNHKCKFLEDKSIVIPTERKEINSKLSDIFSFSKKEISEEKKKDLSADKYDLPCKIELKKNNLHKIKAYLKQNKNINPSKIYEIKDVKRISVASICPYWSPVIPEEYELKMFENAIQRKYTGLNNNKFIFYQRKPGCKFYEQFNSFIDADAIVFNSLKYKLESSLNRKPATEIEIIDECDEFLDSFSNQRTISLNRLQHALNYIFPEDKLGEEVLNDLNIEFSNIIKDKKIEAAVYSKMIVPIKETRIYNLLKILLNNSEFMNCVDDENYLLDVEETARLFDEFFDETYLTFIKKENNLIVSLVTTNLAKRFKEMVDKNKIIVLMSGTIHSENVLRDIFGLDEFDIIEAETTDQGNIEIQKTGLEKDCKYSNFSNGNHNRECYLKALDECIRISKKPALIQVNSFGDLPSKEEIKKFDIKFLPNREELRETQREDKQGKLVDEFKRGDTDVLFSTKCSRGMDFPGEKCKSIIFTKYPNPDVKSAFWKILQQTKPQYYWEFYKDKAERELLQRIYRGLRFKEDHIYLLSPDIRVLDYFSNRKL